MKSLLKNARIAKSLKTTEVARGLSIDAALISKFESGQRLPTKPQLLALSELLCIDFDAVELLWLKEKILLLVKNEPSAVQALEAALSDLTGKISPSEPIPASFQKLMDEMESLKNILSSNIRPQ